MLGEFIRSRVNEDAPATQALREVAVAYARYFELHPEAVELMLQERATFQTQVFPTHLMYRAEKRDEFEAYLTQAVQRGEIRDLDVADVTNAFSDLLYGSVVNGCLEGSKGALLQRVEHAFEIFLRGILPPDSES